MCLFRSAVTYLPSHSHQTHHLHHHQPPLLKSFCLLRSLCAASFQSITFYHPTLETSNSHAFTYLRIVQGAIGDIITNYGIMFPRLAVFFLALLSLLLLVSAVKLPQKSVLISFPDETPSHILDKTKEAITNLGGQITHEYNIFKYV